MWQFAKKVSLPEFKKDKEGNLIFDLTEEEQREVKKTFRLLEEYKIHIDIADELQKGITALALSNYAKEQVLISQIEAQKKYFERLLNKAIAATIKAYSIYQLPIYIYDLACFLEMIGKLAESKYFYKNFLERQSEFKMRQLDELFLEQRDIEEAIKDAKRKLKKLAKDR